MIDDKISKISDYTSSIGLELLDWQINDQELIYVDFHFMNCQSGAEFKMKTYKCYIGDKKIWSDLALHDINVLYNGDFDSLKLLNQYIPLILNKE